MKLELNTQKIDLVILIDTNHSMNKITKSIYTIINRLLEDKNNVNYKFLRVENAKYLKQNNYIFSYNKYLQKYSKYSYIDLSTTNIGVHAINDICKYYPWQEFSLKKILYISDTTITSNEDSNINDSLQTAYAINNAINHEVIISTHFLSSHNLINTYSLDKTKDIYKNLSLSSNGLYEFNKKASKNLYKYLIFEDSSEDYSIKMEDIKPSISISIETNNLNKKVLSIKVHNSYSNISFDDFSIGKVQICDKNYKKINNIIQAKRTKELNFGNIKNNIVNKQIILNDDVDDLTNCRVNLSSIHYHVNYDYEEESNCEFELLHA